MRLTKSFGRYLPRSSFIHVLDPRTKIVTALSLMIFVFFLDTPWDYLGFLTLLLAATILSKIEFKQVLHGIYAVFLLTFLSFLLQLFFAPGEPIFKFGPFKLTQEGLELAFTLSARLFFLAALSALLGFTTSAVEIAGGLEALLKPLEKLKIPVRGISLTLGIAMRFIPVVLEEAENIFKAQRARGVDFSEGNAFTRIRRIVYMLIPLLINSMRRAQDLAEAMEARGYDKSSPRSKLNPLKFTPADYLALVIALGFGAFVILS